MCVYVDSDMLPEPLSPPAVSEKQSAIDMSDEW